MAHVIAADGRLDGLAEAVRAELAALDPNLVMFNTRSLETVVGAGVAREQFAFSLMIIFAIVALTLAVVGIYGVLSYSVSQRYREIGIRIALGARSTRVRRDVIFQGMILVMAGIAAGLAGAIALTRWLESLVYEISTTDPTVFVVAAVVLAIVAFIACAVPAQRATRSDPIAVLRSE